MQHDSFDAREIAKVQDFVIAERHKCLSAREWSFRLRGYGYDVRQEGDAHVVKTLVRGETLFSLTEEALKKTANVEA